jgi:hypothetical protein
MKGKDVKLIFLYHSHNHSRVSVIERAINLIKREVNKVQTTTIDNLIVEIEKVFRNFSQENL